MKCEFMYKTLCQTFNLIKFVTYKVKMYLLSPKNSNFLKVYTPINNSKYFRHFYYPSK